MPLRGSRQIYIPGPKGRVQHFDLLLNFSPACDKITESMGVVFGTKAKGTESSEQFESLKKLSKTSISFGRTFLKIFFGRSWEVFQLKFFFSAVCKQDRLLYVSYNNQNKNVPFKYGYTKISYQFFFFFRKNTTPSNFLRRTP